MSKALTSMSKAELISKVKELQGANKELEASNVELKTSSKKAPKAYTQVKWVCNCGVENTGFGSKDGKLQGTNHCLNSKGEVRLITDKKHKNYGEPHVATFQG